MEKTKRSWTFIFSPYIVIMILLVGVYLYGCLFAKDKNLWVYLVLALDLLLPITIIALAIDMFLKVILKNSLHKSTYIWTIELMLTGFLFIALARFHG